MGILLAAHPTHQGLRIAQQSERTTQKAHAWYILTPCMNKSKTYNVYIPTNHSRVQYTYREHLLLSCPLTVVVSCEVTVCQRQALSKRSLCKVAPTHYPFTGFCKCNAIAKLTIFSRKPIDYQCVFVI